MHSTERNDVTLLVGLAIAALVTFEGPIHRFLQIGRQIEEEHGLALVPGLAILIVVLLGNRLMARIRRVARRRGAEQAGDSLALSRELSLATNREAIGEVLRQRLSAVTGTDDAWVVIRETGQWQSLVGGMVGGPSRLSPVVETLVGKLADHASDPSETPRGERVDGHFCYRIPLGEKMAVLGVPIDPGGDGEERRLRLATTATIIGLALRNAALLAGMEQRGIVDELTGCFNRTHGMKLLETELKRAKRARSSLSIAMVDLDHFKSVNDQHGHLCGDALLMAFGNQLHEMLRNSDIKCRYGGEEFMLLLPDTPLPGAIRVGKMLREEIEKVSVESDGQTVSRTASIGIAVAGPGELDPKALVGRADDALYRAKHTGRNRVCVDGADVDDPSMNMAPMTPELAGQELASTETATRRGSTTTTAS